MKSKASNVLIGFIKELYQNRLDVQYPTFKPYPTA